jgi:hypothetical protein
MSILESEVGEKRRTSGAIHWLVPIIPVIGSSPLVRTKPKSPIFVLGNSLQRERLNFSNLDKLYDGHEDIQFLWQHPMRLKNDL